MRLHVALLLAALAFLTAIPAVLVSAAPVGLREGGRLERRGESLIMQARRSVYNGANKALVYLDNKRGSQTGVMAKANGMAMNALYNVRQAVARRR
ncbi:hypothetical protein HK405_001976 [Cladochytrium tenue]|nr:hypothetical protein HK405_001976 [Cladochytrium tenue]